MKSSSSLWVVAVLVMLGLSGPARAETCMQGGSPVETVSAMLAAAEAGDWDTYVRCFYGELDRVRSPADVEMLIARYRERWADEVLHGLRRVVTMEPVLSEDGRRAEYRLEEGVFTLYLYDEGDWKFRL